MEFRGIFGYKKYEISKCGVVRNVKTKHVLKQKLSGNYLSVGLYTNSGKIKYHNVNRLILMGWSVIPLNYKLLHAAHTDGNSFHNHADNLIWKTPLENAQDKYKHNSFNSPFGEKHHNSKLSNSLVCNLREMANGGVNCKQLSDMFGIPKLTIYDAVVGNTWRSVVDVSPVNLSGRQYAKR